MSDCGQFALVAGDPVEVPERGRGFALMSLLMDEVQLQTDGQTEVRLSSGLRTGVSELCGEGRSVLSGVGLGS